MILAIHPVNPEPRKLAMVTDCLKSGGIIIFPTDTVYGLGCDIFNQKAVEKICRMKGIDPERNNLTILCSSLSHISDFVNHIDNSTFRVLKSCIPGPYTFILEANKKLPKLFKNKKKTVGIRVPDNKICSSLISLMENPILSSSLHDDDTIVDYPTDPEVIELKFGKLVDLVIDGGTGGNVPSTILDCTKNPIELIRQGLGDVDFLT